MNPLLDDTCETLDKMGDRDFRILELSHLINNYVTDEKELEELRKEKQQLEAMNNIEKAFKESEEILNDIESEYKETKYHNRVVPLVDSTREAFKDLNKLYEVMKNKRGL